MRLCHILSPAVARQATGVDNDSCRVLCFHPHHTIHNCSIYFLCINRNDMQIIPPKLFNRIKMNLMGVPIPPFVASSFAEVDECSYLDF